MLVGEDPASQVYVRGKHRAAARVGMRSFDHALPAETPAADLAALIDRLNADPEVDGILVQMPLPGGLDPLPLVERIDPAKDADGLHPMNLGRLVLGRPGLRPATPSGILRLLDHYGIETRGAFVVVVGRSFLVGRPLAILLGLKGRDATVALAHTATRDLPDLTRRADILVAAAGVRGLIGPRAHPPRGHRRRRRGEPDRGRPGGRRGLRRRVRGGRGDHPRARRGGAHDHRRPAGEHGDGGGAPRRAVTPVRHAPRPAAPAGLEAGFVLSFRMRRRTTGCRRW